MDEVNIRWTDYMQYRSQLRGFDLVVVERILRYTDERYVDTTSERFVAVGKHNSQLVMIPYEQEDRIWIPVTIHATTRQQINFRVQSGRFKYE